MDITYILESLFRWLHIIAGVLWIGHLYFFNFVNGQVAAKLSPEAKKEIVPQLMPRALWWFRWGAAWTWITGIVLLHIIYHQGGIMFDGEGQWSTAAWVMTGVVFLGVFLYDALYKSPLAANPKVAHTVAFVVLALIVFLMQSWANFGYRSYVIHTGVLFGTIMAFNVWFRIWPAQQQIIKAVKDGTPPPAELVALAGGRSKHNTYLSVPLLWSMINFHHSLGGFSQFGVAGLLVIVLLGWHIVFQFYNKAGKLEGF